MLSSEIIERYSREILVKEIGVKGIYRLRKSRILIIGCGATGTYQAELFARLGVGFIRIVDKDFVELSNLPRTLLYDYSDSTNALPKSIACANRLKEIEPSIEVDPIIARVTSKNILDLMKDVDIVIDGTDNLTTRFLINDAAVKLGIPWVFVGVVSWYGNVLFINPGKGPCLRCFVPTRLLEREQRNACEVLGVINTTVAMASTISVTLVLKHILNIDPDYNTLYLINAKEPSIMKIEIKRSSSCPTCAMKKFEFLEKEVEREKIAAQICGTRAVEIVPNKRISIDPIKVSKNFNAEELEVANPYLLKIRVNNNISMIVFNDGRAIVDGITDENLALDLYKKYFLNKLNM